MTLAMIPPAAACQQPVLEWAGKNTEQIADLLWTAAGPDREWRTGELVASCLNGTFRESPRVALGQVAERVLVLHESYVRCALSPSAADVAQEKLRTLAGEWGIDLAPDPAEATW